MEARRGIEENTNSLFKEQQSQAEQLYSGGDVKHKGTLWPFPCLAFLGQKGPSKEEAQGNSAASARAPQIPEKSILAGIWGSWVPEKSILAGIWGSWVPEKAS